MNLVSLLSVTPAAKKALDEGLDISVYNAEYVTLKDEEAQDILTTSNDMEAVLRQLDEKITDLKQDLLDSKGQADKSAQDVEDIKSKASSAIRSKDKQIQDLNNEIAQLKEQASQMRNKLERLKPLLEARNSNQDSTASLESVYQDIIDVMRQANPNVSQISGSTASKTMTIRLETNNGHIVILQATRQNAKQWVNAGLRIHINK